MDHLPTPAAPAAHRTVVQLADGTWTYSDTAPAPVAPVSGPQVVHVHQAPPDRTLQRAALGAGIGGGTVAAGVYFGPLLVAALSAIAANLAFLVLLLAVAAWGVREVVNAVGSKEGEKAAENVRKGLRRRRG